MNDINGEGRTSMWPDKKLDWVKLLRCQLNANCHSTPDGASGDAIHSAEFKWENHSLLRRDLQRSEHDRSQYFGIYVFLFLLFALLFMMRYVIEEGYTVSSVHNPFYSSSADISFNFF
jgi:hypothetical protein